MIQSPNNQDINIQNQNQLKIYLTNCSKLYQDFWNTLRDPNSSIKQTIYISKQIQSSLDQSSNQFMINIINNPNDLSSLTLFKDFLKQCTTFKKESNLLNKKLLQLQSNPIDQIQPHNEISKQKIEKEYSFIKQLNIDKDINELKQKNRKILNFHLGIAILVNIICLILLFFNMQIQELGKNKLNIYHQQRESMLLMSQIEQECLLLNFVINEDDIQQKQIGENLLISLQGQQNFQQITKLIQIILYQSINERIQLVKNYKIKFINQNFQIKQLNLNKSSQLQNIHYEESMIQYISYSQQLSTANFTKLFNEKPQINIEQYLFYILSNGPYILKQKQEELTFQFNQAFETVIKQKMEVEFMVINIASIFCGLLFFIIIYILGKQDMNQILYLKYLELIPQGKIDSYQNQIGIFLQNINEEINIEKKSIQYQEIQQCDGISIGLGNEQSFNMLETNTFKQEIDNQLNINISSSKRIQYFKFQTFVLGNTYFYLIIFAIGLIWLFQVNQNTIIRNNEYSLTKIHDQIYILEYRNYAINSLVFYILSQLTKNQNNINLGESGQLSKFTQYLYFNNQTDMIYQNIQNLGFNKYLEQLKSFNNEYYFDQFGNISNQSESISKGLFDVQNQILTICNDIFQNKNNDKLVQYKKVIQFQSIFTESYKKLVKYFMEDSELFFRYQIENWIITLSWKLGLIWLICWVISLMVKQHYYKIKNDVEIISRMIPEEYVYLGKNYFSNQSEQI